MINQICVPANEEERLNMRALQDYLDNMYFR